MVYDTSILRSFLVFWLAVDLLCFRCRI